MALSANRSVKKGNTNGRASKPKVPLWGLDCLGEIWFFELLGELFDSVGFCHDRPSMRDGVFSWLRATRSAKKQLQTKEASMSIMRKHQPRGCTCHFQIARGFQNAPVGSG